MTGSSASGNGYGISFTDRTDWGTGFVADLAITTADTAFLQGWTLSFDLADDIQQIWGATIVSHVGTHYVIDNVDYDNAVAPGTSIAPGFIATGTDHSAPTHFVLPARRLNRQAR